MSEKKSMTALFDEVLRRYKLKNDAELARKIGVNQPQICRMRAGTDGLSAGVVLALYEHLGMPVKQIREWAKK